MIDMLTKFVKYLKGDESFKYKSHTDVRLCTFQDWKVGTCESESDGIGYVIIESSPCCRTLLCDGNYHFLPFPYVIFICKLIKDRKSKYTVLSISIGVRHKPLDSIKDIIYHFPMTNNILRRYQICVPLEYQSHSSPIKAAKNAVDIVWNSFWRGSPPSWWLKMAGRKIHPKKIISNINPNNYFRPKITIWETYNFTGKNIEINSLGSQV